MMVCIPTNRTPTHPGTLLWDAFLVPMNISQRDLADAIHVPYHRINEIVNQKRGVTPSTALRLTKFFGLSAELWLDQQIRWDLYNAQTAEKMIWISFNISIMCKKLLNNSSHNLINLR